QAATTYLDIKELGIKIKLDASIKDAVYSVKSASSGGGQFAYISTQSLTDKSGGTCSPNNGSIAAITKASGTLQQVFGGPDGTRPIPPVDNTTVFKFGSDTYVFISPPQATCSEDSTIQALANQQKAIFFNDFKTVQLDN
ncbi:MAG TPA: hypothetical protein VNG90_02185, partial [Candidatus Acidoferrum sp.]|nr:hypothetical protein [Candidatus Acidoferrum sp.]